jgi:hypothetical protein
MSPRTVLPARPMWNMEMMAAAMTNCRRFRSRLSVGGDTSPAVTAAVIASTIRTAVARVALQAGPRP